jgi:preprotein translocase subunit SecG
MFSFLMAVQIIVSVLLIAVILMQSSKGGGLAGTFGGGSVGMVFGVRRTADFLTRGTQILAGTFLVLSLVINVFFLPKAGTSEESVLQKGTQTQQQQQSTAPPPMQLPPPPAEPAPGGDQAPK